MTRYILKNKSSDTSEEEKLRKELINMPENKSKFGVDVVKHDKDQWSFGICLSHWLDETYIYINFFRYSISIGKIVKIRKYED